MIHHVGLEVHPEELDACVEFWILLGFERAVVPDAIGEVGRWMQHGSHQIHLQAVDQPVVPSIGHPALVDPGLDATVERLRAAGHEVLERTPYWDARRIFTRCPAGHRVELMAAPPKLAPAASVEASGGASEPRA